MKNFFTSIKARLHQFMSGRYGFDELSRTLWTVSLVFLILALVPKLQIFGTFGMVLWFYVLFRSFSRNTSRRQQERDAYLRQVGKVKDHRYWQKQKWILRDSYRFYRCKQCGKMLRVPKGKGKIKITCPQCKSQFIKKT